MEPKDKADDNSTTMPEGTTTESTPTNRPSNEAGTQLRGTKEDWWRKAEEGNATDATGDDASAAGKSSDPKSDDADTSKKKVTYRDGALRD